MGEVQHLKGKQRKKQLRNRGQRDRKKNMAKERGNTKNARESGPVSGAAKMASGDLKNAHGHNQRSLVTSAKTAVRGRCQMTTAWEVNHCIFVGGHS